MNRYWQIENDDDKLSAKATDKMVRVANRLPADGQYFGAVEAMGEVWRELAAGRVVASED